MEIRNFFLKFKISPLWGFILGLIIFLIWTRYGISKADKIREQYVQIEYNNYLSGIVITKMDQTQSAFNKGLSFIELSTGTRFYLPAFTNNKLYSISSFSNFVEIGDSIYKKANNDTIYLYRSDKEYYFVLNK